MRLVKKWRNFWVQMTYLWDDVSRFLIKTAICLAARIVVVVFVVAKEFCQSKIRNFRQ